MQTFLKPLKSAEERKYLNELAEGSAKAREMLILHNMRLVAHVVKKYAPTESEAEDLISIGTIGLIKAVDTFDVKRASRLGTYAAKCIDNEILMHLRAEKKRSREVSLFEPIGTDKEGNVISLVDIIESEDEDILETVAVRRQVEEMYRNLETLLPEREKQIISLRYGLFGQKEMTQREIAERLGISRSYVSRIEKSGLSKMRAAMESKIEK